MNKYIVKETIPWEGYNQWTVFALSEEDAKLLIKSDMRYSSEFLSVTFSKTAKGRKEERIHKFYSDFSQ